jgi:glycosyltransferase involved in cell wall biosynthesis
VKPVLLVTSDVPPDRVAPFRALAERTPLVVARFGAARRHASQGVGTPDGVPVRDVAQHDVFALAASGDFRAVVGGTVGRVALPAAYAGARRARVPFVLWSALWSQPHVSSAPLMRHLYRHADAVAGYGSHVTAYARTKGADNVHIAPQAVDAAFWARRDGPREADGPFRVLYVGRIEHEKGAFTLLEAWRRTALRPPAASLTVVGGGSPPPLSGTAPGQLGITFTGPETPGEVRNFLQSASVVVVPSIATRSFKEPWALIVNEAMHQQLPIIATHAVGAVAGGLVRHERNGLVVPDADPSSLALALERLAGDRPLGVRLGASGARDVAAFTPDAWAAGMVAAIDSTETSR